jgi:hypothetical protein
VNDPSNGRTTTSLARTSISPDERVSGDVVAMGGDIVLGEVDGDCVAIGGSVTLREGAEVGGEVVSMGGVVTLEDSTRVGSDVVSMWGKVKASPSADVGGHVSDVGFGGFHPDKIGLVDEEEGMGHRVLMFLGRVVWVLLLVGLGILAYSVFPRRMQRLSETVERRGLVTFLAGMAGWILWLPAFALLCITIGIPVAILLVVFADSPPSRLPVRGPHRGKGWKPLSSEPDHGVDLPAGVFALEAAVLGANCSRLVGSFLHFGGPGRAGVVGVVRGGDDGLRSLPHHAIPERDGVPIDAAIPRTPPPQTLHRATRWEAETQAPNRPRGFDATRARVGRFPRFWRRRAGGFFGYRAASLTNRLRSGVSRTEFPDRAAGAGP